MRLVDRCAQVLCSLAAKEEGHFVHRFYQQLQAPDFTVCPNLKEIDVFDVCWFTLHSPIASKPKRPCLDAHDTGRAMSSHPMVVGKSESLETSESEQPSPATVEQHSKAMSFKNRVLELRENDRRLGVTCQGW